MVDTYVMPSALTAELYHALGDIPGMTVDVHAVDAAGRPGVGFVSPDLPGGGNQELIFSRRTYQFMGDETLAGPDLQRQNGVAIPRMALVSGPGLAPPGPAAGS